MTIIEQIKAEIENALHILGPGCGEIEMGQISAYGHILSVLSTLKSEKPSLTWGDIQLIDSFILELLREERNGADWGDGEKFYSEVLRRYIDFDKYEVKPLGNGYVVENKSEKPINQDELEEEFNHYCFDFKNPDTGEDIPKNQISFSVEDALNVARHFAEWGAEHLKK